MSVLSYLQTPKTLLARLLPRVAKKANTHANWIVFIAAVAFFVVFSVIALHRFWQFSSWYYDFGIFYQAISSVARGDAPIIDHLIVPNKHIFADHFHPIIFAVVPAFWLVPLPETLLVFQALSVAASGWCIFLLGKAVLRSPVRAAVFTVLYYSFFGLHFALITEFHEIALLPLPLAAFLYGMVTRKKLLLLLAWIGVLIAKETTFIIPAWFGLVMLFSYPKKEKIWGGAITVLSIVYGYVVLKVVIPSFSGTEYYYASGVGLASTLENIETLVLHPTIYKIFGAHGFLPLLAPETLPPILFNWWSRVQTGGPRISLGMHYNAEIAPTLIFGSMIAWKRLQWVFQKCRVRRFEPYVLLTLLASLVVLNVYVFKSPALLFINKAFYRHTETSAFLDTLISHIPENGTVMAQHNIAARLAYRKVYILRNNYWDFNPDYIVIDTRDGQEPNNFFGISRWDDLLSDLETDEGYEVYYSQGEQLIYKKIGL